ncbi:MAG: RNA pyrophosphohydrolase [Pseudomonadota bacterium]
MSSDQIDENGYRANVGIIVANDSGKLLLAGRAGRKGWQFPQGGVSPGEDAEQAMFRELYEELGLEPGDVQLLGATEEWIPYRLPDRYLRKNSKPLCIGQKQRWFVLRLIATEEKLRFDTTEKPEFDRWRWVDYWRPVNEVIYFKRRVYARALHELAPLLHPDGAPPQPRWWPHRWRSVFRKDLQKAGLLTTEAQQPSSVSDPVSRDADG